MSDLHLDSLGIQNFRGFQDFRIDRLARVNLLVGKNNVGKTSILEALQFYSQPTSVHVLINMLLARDEVDPDSLVSHGGQYGRARALDVKHLFFGRDPVFIPGMPPPTITIRDLMSPAKSVSISLELNKGDHGLLDRVLKVKVRGFIFDLPIYDIERILLLPDLLRTFHPREVSEPNVASTFFGANGLTRQRVGSLWDDIVLTPSEDVVIAAMRLVAGDVERLILKPIEEGAASRVPFVRMKGLDYPVSLRSLGDGTNRMFSLALSMVNAKEGLFLVDEVENGIHYSIQPQLWRFIFETARRLDVQVFATTHSYDCIKAFEEAARESEEEGVLIRLAQKEGRRLVAEFNEEELGIAVEGQIEIR